MELSTAIHQAIEYEKQIRDLYKDALVVVKDPAGKRMLQKLSEDESYHVQYLEKRLAEWTKTGKITVEPLKEGSWTTEHMQKTVKEMKTNLTSEELHAERQLLQKAFQVEMQANKMYNQLVNQLDNEGKEMFSYFLKIEDGHVQYVQGHLDYLNNNGFWFDTKEFDMEL